MSIPAQADGDRADELRRTASELFFSKGYEATTTREIARLLGIKSASIYYHYANKEEILYAVIHLTMEQLTFGLRRMLDLETEPENRLAGLVANHVTLHALRPKETTLGDTELRSLTGKRRERIFAMRDEYEGLVVGLLEAGQRNAAFQILDPKLTAYAVIAQATNVGSWYQPGGRVSLGQIVHTYANVALRLASATEVLRPTSRRLTEAARRIHLTPPTQAPTKGRDEPAHTR
jgi:TetR/AcrR family transcriptional regulator, cholesterol catabolism regulator